MKRLTRCSAFGDHILCIRRIRVWDLFKQAADGSIVV